LHREPNVALSVSFITQMRHLADGSVHA